MSQVIVASAGTADQTGLAYNQRIFWLASIGCWVLPVIKSTELNKIRFYYNTSQDFTQGTWVEMTGSPVTLNQSLVGGGANWSVTYYHPGGLNDDIVHGIYGNNPGTIDANYFRGYFGTYSITFTHDAALNRAANTFGPPHSAPYGLSVYAGPDAAISHTIADGAASGLWVVNWTASDLGIASGWSEVGTQNWGNVIYASQTTDVNGVGQVGGVTSSRGGVMYEDATDVEATSMKEPRFVENNRNAHTPGTDASAGFSVLGAGVNHNNFGFVNRTNVTADGTDLHAVLRTGSNTYSHRRYSGAWGAGSAIPNQSSKADSGLAMSSDGINVWLFIIDSDAANSVRYIRWNGSAWDATWSLLEGSTKTRDKIVCSRRVGRYSLNSVSPVVPTTIGVAWTETNGGTFDVVGAALDVGSVFAGAGASPRFDQSQHVSQFAAGGAGGRWT